MEETPPSHGEWAPQLTPTDPSRTIYPRQPDATVEPERNHKGRAGPAAATATRKPASGARTARAVEQVEERDAVAERHFRSNLSCWWVGMSLLASYRTVSHNVNIVLLQYAPNLLNVPLIHAGNTNAAVNLTVTVLHNFKLKRDTVQAKNYLPAQ